MKSIQQEHEMFSSYVKVHHRSPAIVVSHLERKSGLIHSCHFVLKNMSLSGMTFVMLVTYTDYGVRLSCSKFERPISLQDDHSQETGVSPLDVLVQKHFRVGYFS